MRGFLDFVTTSDPPECRQIELPKKVVSLGAKGDSVEVEIVGSASLNELGTQIGNERRAMVFWDRRAGTWSFWVPHGIAESMGARLNGNQVPPKPWPLQHLDRFEFSGAKFRFRRELAPPSVGGSAAEKIFIGKNVDLIRIGRGHKIREGADGVPDPPDNGEAAVRRSIAWELDPEDAQISSRHLYLERDVERKRWIAHDESKMGSELNGESFKEAELVFGDRFRIGDYFFEFGGASLRWVDRWAEGNISARDVGVTVKTAGGPKEILRGVSLDIRSGEFIGILGGSGQGKSTMMNALCGINPATAGKVWIDNMPLEGRGSVKKLSIGFVPQEDIVHSELTVDQAITFSAKLRLRLPGAVIKTLVDGVIGRLGLEEHRLKRISQLSGGQRKRVSIATELLAKPGVLFLDEPSSGLDPATEADLMELLQLLSLTGMTVICTTHVLQKAYLFDRICFIHGGRLIFIGKEEEAKEFFAEPQRASVQASASGTATGRGGRAKSLERIYKMLADPKTDAAEHEERFMASAVAARQADNFPPPPAQIRKEPKKKVGYLRSLWLLMRRQWKILSVDKLNLLFLAAQAALIGGLVGWVSDDPGLRMFLAVIATLWFGCSNAAQQIVSELPIFRRERVSGLGLNAYIQSKFVFLFAITSLQSVALLVAVVGSAAYFHPLDLPDDDQAFLAGIYERLHPAQIATADQVRAAGGPLRTGDSISEGGGRAFAIEEPEEIDLGESRFTSDGRQMADAGDWQIRALMFLARHFQMEPNLLESADQRARQVFATADEPATGVSRGIPLPRVIGVCLGLRLAALQLAALVGVSMGLAISALAQSNTQAVMWVPLVLIPQILFGAFVVALPEMPRSARLFCQAMPSFAAQRLIDVGHLYGQRTPKMTNLTRIPSYLSNEKAPRDTEEVRWTQAGEEKESEFEKISVHNTSWQNLAVLHDLVGQHEKQRDSSADEVNSVNRRNDSLYRRFDVYANTGPAAISAGVLGGWIASCYVIIGLSLLRRQYGK